VVGALALVGAAAAVAATARQVRALRRNGVRVVPLEVDLELAGPGPVRRLVVLGDSAAAGHGLPDPEQGLARRVGRALHLRDGRAVSVRSVARDGAMVADVLGEQADEATGADVVIVGVGVNDALRRRDTATVGAEVAALLARVREVAAPDARIVLLTCPDLSAAPGLPRLVRPLVGMRCRAIAEVEVRAAGAQGVAVVTASRRDLPPEVFGEDGFHPGVIGHERLAASVLALV
jgi:lysophospholipase L1-like esterase